MGNRQNDDLIPSKFEYDAPVPDAQAQRRIASQSLDLATNSHRVDREFVERALDPASDRRIQRVELPRRLRREDDGPSAAHAGFFSFTTLCSVSSAVSKKRRTPRAAWRMRCSFSTSARRT